MGAAQRQVPRLYHQARDDFGPPAKTSNNTLLRAKDCGPQLCEALPGHHRRATTTRQQHQGWRSEPAGWSASAARGAAAPQTLDAAASKRDQLLARERHPPCWTKTPANSWPRLGNNWRADRTDMQRLAQKTQLTDALAATQVNHDLLAPRHDITSGSTNAGCSFGRNGSDIAKRTQRVHATGSAYRTAGALG